MVVQTQKEFLDGNPFISAAEKKRILDAEEKSNQRLRDMFPVIDGRVHKADVARDTAATLAAVDYKTPSDK